MKTLIEKIECGDLVRKNNKWITNDLGNQPAYCTGPLTGLVMSAPIYREGHFEEDDPMPSNLGMIISGIN